MKMKKYLPLCSLLYLANIPAQAQISSFFSNEYKEKFENARQSNLQLSEENYSLRESVRNTNALNQQLTLKIEQLELANKQLEQSTAKLKNRLDHNVFENKRIFAQVQQLKKDTANLGQQLRYVSTYLAQVETESKERSAKLEKQIFVLTDSLGTNSRLYQQNSQELSKIQSLVSLIKIGDMEFNIPADQFIKTLHSAILSDNTKVVLRTDNNSKAILFYKFNLRKKAFIGYRQVPCRLEAFITYLPHPIHTTEKTILSIRTHSYYVKKGNETEVTDFAELGLAKNQFYKELERISYSYDSNSPGSLTTSHKEK